jgi:hypothetical protein
MKEGGMNMISHLHIDGMSSNGKVKYLELEVLEPISLHG